MPLTSEGPNAWRMVGEVASEEQGPLRKASWAQVRPVGVI